MRRRCGWARDPLDVQHHDEEWGVPEHDDRRLFEFLILEGAQAGLSWLTILRKRDAYRRAFAGFDPEQVACFSESDVRRLLGDDGIVRNRAKIEATIGNARGCRAVQREYGSFAAYVWRFVGGTPIQNAWTSLSEVPSETDASRALSRDLAKRGFRFVGPTICYAFMQSVGMVNDHVVDCFRWAAVRRLARPSTQDTTSPLPRSPRHRPKKSSDGQVRDSPIGELKHRLPAKLLPGVEEYREKLEKLTAEQGGRLTLRRAMTRRNSAGAQGRRGHLNRRIRFPFRGEDGSLSFYVDGKRGRRGRRA